jgi:S1-C subfamily serine protease
MNKKIVFPAAAIVLAISLVACQLSSYFSTAVPTATVAPLSTLPSSSATMDYNDRQDRLMAIYQQFNPGVVSIRTSDAEGSGWVYSSDGVIVTNNHVVGSESQVEVDFPTGLKAFGKVLGSDANCDLAAIKVDVDSSELHPLPLGDSGALQVGQTVIAIGNPFGLSGSMSTGIISALGRALQTNNVASSGSGYYTIADVIQTDAALNVGNSGGPLLNLNGEVVGVNYAIETTSYSVSGEPSGSGVGFAISVNVVKRVIPSLIQNGKFDYPYLGMGTLDDLSLSVMNSLGLTSTYGVYVVSVTDGGPSDKAGLIAGTQPLNLAGYTGLNKGGDLIVAIDGQKVVVFDDIVRYLILNKSPGDTVTFTVLRGSEKMDLPLVLGKRP